MGAIGSGSRRRAELAAAAPGGDVGVVATNILDTSSSANGVSNWNSTVQPARAVFARHRRSVTRTGEPVSPRSKEEET
jgi:hypothetical protein